MAMPTPKSTPARTRFEPPSPNAKVRPETTIATIPPHLLRLYHQTWGNLARTFLPTLGRDLLALGYVLAKERTSLPAYAWLWRHRRDIGKRRRCLQQRRNADCD